MNKQGAKTYHILRIIYTWDLNHVFTNFPQIWLFAEHDFLPA